MIEDIRERRLLTLILDDVDKEHAVTKAYVYSLMRRYSARKSETAYPTYPIPYESAK